MSEEMGRRVAAARALGGFKSREALAKKAKVGADKIKRVEGGGRDLEHPELLAIAKACRLSEDFFSVDFERLTTGAAETGDEPPLSTVALRNELGAELAEVLRRCRRSPYRRRKQQLHRRIDHQRRGCELRRRITAGPDSDVSL